MSHSHPFDWMPKAGKSVKLPGDGVLWCEQWKILTGGDFVEGEIVFKFQMRKDEYLKAMEQSAIAETPTALPSPPAIDI